MRKALTILLVVVGERRVVPGRDLSINTSGASFLAGNAAADVLLWGALQTGEWGTVDQEAWAFLVDVGRRFDNLPGKPSFHLAWEQSSGDSRPGAGDHETFFNVLPIDGDPITDYVINPGEGLAVLAALGSLVNGRLRRAATDAEAAALLGLLAAGAVAALAWFPLQIPFTAMLLLLAAGRGWRLIAEAAQLPLPTTARFARGAAQ